MIITFLGFNTFSVIDLVKSILPVSFNQYWFMRVYLYMVLCAPFLNILLNNLNKQGHQYLIALGFMLMVIPARVFRELRLSIAMQKMEYSGFLCFTRRGLILQNTRPNIKQDNIA